MLDQNVKPTIIVSERASKKWKTAIGVTAVNSIYNPSATIITAYKQINRPDQIPEVKFQCYLKTGKTAIRSAAVTSYKCVHTVRCPLHTPTAEQWNLFTSTWNTVIPIQIWHSCFYYYSSSWTLQNAYMEALKTAYILYSLIQPVNYNKLQLAVCNKKKTLTPKGTLLSSWK